MSPKVDETELSAETRATTTRNLELLKEFVAETIADETFQLPPGVTVLLVPDDDVALAEKNIASGMAAIREGKNVYFHHLHRAGAANGQGKNGTLHEQERESITRSQL